MNVYLILTVTVVKKHAVGKVSLARQTGYLSFYNMSGHIVKKRGGEREWDWARL